jgi:hypothetical protein
MAKNITTILMATRITDYFISKVKRHLKENDIPFMNVNDSKNLMILRPAGNYHYLVIQFFEMPDEWMYDRRHFSIKTAYAIDFNQIINSIKRYLKDEHATADIG